MAAIGLRSVAVIMGAGYTGSYIYNNLTFDSARSLAAEILLRQKAAESASADSSRPASSPDTRAVSALSEKFDRLSSEVVRSRSDPVLIVGPQGYKGSLATVTDVFNLLGWVVFAVTVGSGIYYVAVRKHLSIRDLAWVSQSTFNGTVSAMQAGIARVSGAVGAVRRDLGERLRVMEARVDNVRDTLSKQIEKDVGEVKDGVRQVSENVSHVKCGVEDAITRIEQMDYKIDATNSGIRALIGVVSSMAPEKLKPGSPFHSLRRYLEMSENGGGEVEGPMLRPRLSQTGLAGLLGSAAAASESVDSESSRPDRRKKRSADRTSSAWSSG